MHQVNLVLILILLIFRFFYLGFHSQTFTIRRTAGEGEGYLIDSSSSFRPASLAGRLL